MEHYPDSLSGIFQALADPTRRAVLGQLGRGAASVGELAQHFDMKLPSFMKHIHFLEEQGLIRTHKQGRVRTCTLDQARLSVIDGWLSEQRAIWEGRTDRLEQFVVSGQDIHRSRDNPRNKETSK